MEKNESDMTRITKRLIAEINDYAKGRKSDVARGAETPELAALLVQKYGYGLCKAAVIITDNHRGLTDMMSHVDAAVASIDPNWRENDKKRWAARPAGLSYGSSCKKQDSAETVE